MAFTVFFVTAWLLISIFTIIPKRLTVIENSFLFLLTSVISIHWTWIVNEELKYVQITKDPVDYAGFLIFRSVIIPTLIITQLNLYSFPSSVIKKAIVLSTSVLCLLLLTILSKSLGVSTYEDWNLAFDVIYYIALHALSIVTWKLFRNLTGSGVNHL